MTLVAVSQEKMTMHGLQFQVVIDPAPYQKPLIRWRNPVCDFNSTWKAHIPITDITRMVDKNYPLMRTYSFPASQLGLPCLFWDYQWSWGHLFTQEDLEKISMWAWSVVSGQ